MTDLLTLISTERAEGLSLYAGQQPAVHLGGEPHPIVGPPITAENADTLFRYLATTRQIREFREHGKADFIYTFQGSTQFKVQARMQHDQLQLELQRLSA